MSAAPRALRAEVNGEGRELAPGTTVAALVDTLVGRRSGCAVARNGEVVPRSTWSVVTIEEGDHLELLTAAPGG